MSRWISSRDCSRSICNCSISASRRPSDAVAADSGPASVRLSAQAWVPAGSGWLCECIRTFRSGHEDSGPSPGRRIVWNLRPSRRCRLWRLARCHLRQWSGRSRRRYPGCAVLLGIRCCCCRRGLPSRCSRSRAIGRLPWGVLVGPGAVALCRYRPGNEYICCRNWKDGSPGRSEPGRWYDSQKCHGKLTCRVLSGTATREPVTVEAPPAKFPSGAEATPHWHPCICPC